MDRSTTDIETSSWSGSQPMCPMHRAPAANDITISLVPLRSEATVCTLLCNMVS